MAVLAIAAAGAWIGSGTAGALGMSGAALGWNIGALVGGQLFAPSMPNVNQQGPRLGDLKVQASTYGNPIPIVYGAMRVAGNLIWAADIAETAHTTTQDSGGKGGGGGGSVTQTNYSYSQSFAISVSEGEIVGIRKIWANGKLIYNLSDTADIATIIASNKSATGIRIHTGSETQTADSLIQANEGAANTPAYRGTAYVVFENLQLADYGNRMPNLEFEVVDNGTGVAVAVASNALLASRDWIAAAYGNGMYVVMNQGMDGVYVETSNDGVNWVERLTTIPYATYTMTFGGGKFYAAHGSANNGIWSSFDGVVWTLCASGSQFAGIGYGDGLLYAVSSYQNIAIRSIDGINWTTETLPSAGWGDCAVGNGVVVATGISVGKAAVRTTGGGWSPISLPLGGILKVAFGAGIFLMAGTNAIATSTDGINWAITSAPTIAPHAVTYGNGYFAVVGNGKVLVTVDGITFTESAQTGTYYAVCAGHNGFLAPRSSAAIILNFVGGNVITTTSTSLSSIVSDICTRAGLTAGQIDVTALTDTVSGYVVQRSSARAQIEQLMRAFYFDAVESDGKIKFVKRGGTSAVSIPEDDLAAHEYGSAPPDTLVTNRKQEMELPVEFDVQYMDSAAAYQIGSQVSQRLTTSSENKASLNLALSLSAPKAKQIADVLMYDAWTSRTTFDQTHSWKYSYLEPTDIITVTKAGRSYVMRIVDEDASGGIYRRQAVLEDTTVYTQSAAAAESVAPGETVTGVPLTDLLLLDIPLLRDQDDGVGFYAAACGYGDGWTGAQAFKSNDAGATWGSFGSGLLNDATIGTASSVLGDFTQNIFDEANSVTVTLLNGTLSSDIELNVLNGANVALLGDELLQFRDATLTDTNTYTLTGLLRGRQGTEWARSTHVMGERFVLLSSSTTYLFTGASAEYDLVRKYRGVSFGGFLNDAADIDFANTAVALIPYAPVQLGGGRNAALDVTLNWTRRTRIGGGWNNYADVPLGEASEAYVVQIYASSAYATLKRTISGLSSPTTPYTAAQQVTDFGVEQSTVYWKVCQVSATVGNGYEARGIT